MRIYGDYNIGVYRTQIIVFEGPNTIMQRYRPILPQATTKSSTCKMAGFFVVNFRGHACLCRCASKPKAKIASHALVFMV